MLMIAIDVWSDTALRALRCVVLCSGNVHSCVVHIQVAVNGVHGRLTPVAGTVRFRQLTSHCKQSMLSRLQEDEWTGQE